MEVPLQDFRIKLSNVLHQVAWSNSFHIIVLNLLRRESNLKMALGDFLQFFPEVPHKSLVHDALVEASCVLSEHGIEMILYAIVSPTQLTRELTFQE